MRGQLSTAGASARRGASPKVTVKYAQQSARFKAERAANPYYARLNFSSAQATMRRLEKGFTAFFRRLKAGEKPGYPRFRGRDRYGSIEFPAYGDGIRLTGKKLRVQHVGTIRVKLHREPQGVVKTATLKREAGRWLASLILSLRFETQSRETHHPAVRLAELAKLQRAVARCGLIEEAYKPLQAKIGEIGGMVEADAKLIAMTLRATVPALSRLTALLKLACGEVCPLGPAADRARAEALKLARQDDTRAELTVAPDRVDQIRDLLKHAALAA